MRSTAAAERLGELRMAGRVPRSQAEVLADQAFAEARLDAAEAKREREAAELRGKGKPRQWVTELAAVKAEREARQAAEATTPVTQAEAKGLQQQIGNLKTFLLAVTGKKPF
jgi:hypothetical protein